MTTYVVVVMVEGGIGGVKERENKEIEGEKREGSADSLYQRRTVNSADGNPYHARRWLMLSLK